LLWIAQICGLFGISGSITFLLSIDSEFLPGKQKLFSLRNGRINSLLTMFTYISWAKFLQTVCIHCYIYNISVNLMLLIKSRHFFCLGLKNTTNVHTFRTISAVCTWSSYSFLHVEQTFSSPHLAHLSHVYKVIPM